MPPDTIRVLLVDDHEMVAESLALALASKPDIEVVGTALSAHDGYELARARSPDVVVLDYRLPDARGDVAVSRIREECPGAKVVIVTASPDDDAIAAAVSSGCSGFVSKQRGVGELVDAVRAAARGEAVVSADVLARVLPKLGHGYRPLGLDLTPREREVLDLLAQGLSGRAIAERLVVSSTTVSNHVQHLTRKLGAHSRLEAVSIALREGLVGYV